MPEPETRTDRSRTAHTGHPEQEPLEPLLQKAMGADQSPGTHALASFLKNSPDPVILFNPDGSVLAKNQRGYALWDGNDDFIPKKLTDAVIQVAGGGSAIHEEKKNNLITIKAEGRKRYFLPTLFRLFEDHEKDKGTVSEQVVACVLKDETIWVRTEHIRKNLFASISHELNTPLTSARLSLYLLAEQQIGPLNDQQLELVESAKEDLDREIITIRNVVDMIRSDSIEQRTKHAEVLSLQRLVNENISKFEPQSKSLKLDIRRDEADADPSIVIERTTAELVMHQIFASALKYSAVNGSLKVRIYVRDNDSVLELKTENQDEADFPPDDLFTMEMENPRARQLSVVDLGLRVAHEMIAPYEGAIESQHYSQQVIIRFRFPLSQG